MAGTSSVNGRRRYTDGHGPRRTCPRKKKSRRTLTGSRRVLLVAGAPELEGATAATPERPSCGSFTVNHLSRADAAAHWLVRVQAPREGVAVEAEGGNVQGATVGGGRRRGLGPDRRRQKEEGGEVQGGAAGGGRRGRPGRGRRRREIGRRGEDKGLVRPWLFFSPFFPCHVIDPWNPANQ
jgi:hypothetical protein